jgi:glycopeptide antibiotics resistance protein
LTYFKTVSLFRSIKLFIRISGALYTVLLFYIFFLARRRPHATLFKHKEGINLIPLKSKWIDFVTYQSLAPFFKWNFITDIFGNILLFIPIPFFLHFIFNIKNPRTIILIAFITSTCVEITQFILSVGIADVDDIILNTTGAGLGIAFLILLQKWLPKLYLVFNNNSAPATS